MTVKNDSSKESTAAPPLFVNPTNHTYHNPTPGRITIGAITPTDGITVPSDELCKGMTQCGFNCALVAMPTYDGNSTTNQQLFIDTLDIFANNNVSVFLQTKVTSALVNELKNKPNLAGWWLNTPVFSELENLNENIPDQILKMETENKSAYPRMIIFSAHPNQETSGATEYQQYLEAFQKVWRPSVLYYAVYPEVILANGRVFNDYNLFYRDLQIFSLLSLYSERPLWFTIRCQSYVTKNGSRTPDPSEEEMRFAAFSALGYGAQGLLYWSYRLRTDNSNDTFLKAPIDRNGTKIKEVWNAVQNVNREVIALNRVFFGSNLVQVRPTKVQYDATSLLDGGFGPLKDISTGAVGVQLSHLNTNGIDYLLIVNHGFSSYSGGAQSILMHFAPEFTIHQISVKDGLYTEDLISIRDYSCTLQMGGYLLFRWNK